MDGAEVRGVKGFRLDGVMVKPGALADFDLGDGIGEISADAKPHVILDHGGLGAIAQDD